MKIGWKKILLLVFLLGVFWAGIFPQTDLDIWIHLKSGELIAQKGLVSRDVFSYNTAGREWLIQEWLFQLATFWVARVIGIGAMPILAAGVGSLLVAVIYLIGRRVFGIPMFWAGWTGFAFWIMILDFVTWRPHLPALLLMWVNLFLILLYVFRKKNYLWVSLPVTLVWINFHSSAVLTIGLMGLYAAACLLLFWKTNDRTWFVKTRMLGIYSGLNLLVTLLPPPGIKQYRLLKLYFDNHDVLTRFSNEWFGIGWGSSIANPYWVSVALVLGLLFFAQAHEKKRAEYLLLLPLAAFIVSPLLAMRNLIYAQTGLALTVCFLISRLNPKAVERTALRILQISSLAISVVLLWLLVNKKLNPKPVRQMEGAVNFVRSHHIQGRMLNQFGFGGYLMYHLYPEQRVFFDGRSDLYFCCEIRDYIRLADEKFSQTSEYQMIVKNLLDKYRISFVIMNMQTPSIWYRISEILTSDPDWSLVYWDEVSQIIAKRDGNNDGLISELGAMAATPFGIKRYKTGSEIAALGEYQRMLKVADSARSRNAVGLIYFGQGNMKLAGQEFEKAIAVDPKISSAYVNLAEVKLKNREINEAIELMRKAISISPGEAFIYKRLGDLYLETGDAKLAEIIYREGERRLVK